MMNDLVVAQLGDVELLADAAAQRRRRRASACRCRIPCPARAFSTFSILPHSGRMAWNRRVAAHLGGAACGVALDDEDLGARRGLVSRQSASLPGMPAGLQRDLAAHQLPGLSGGLPGAGGLQWPFQRWPWPPPGSPQRSSISLSVDHVGHQACGSRYCPASPWSGLQTAASCSLTRDDAGQTLAARPRRRGSRPCPSAGRGCGRSR